MNKISVYKEDLDFIRLLPQEEQAGVILAVLDYMFNDIEPSGLSIQAKMVFNQIASKAKRRAKDAERVKRHRNKNGEG